MASQKARRRGARIAIAGR